ncbi:MAG: cysteine--tRNA ligase, partial [Parcubacteria group bacterium]|nr:cysteine--tRNA ligase [Parcubacteria group bacterium]
YIHIGNARTFSFFDALVKFIRLRLGIKINYLQNITDIDDKIIARAHESKEDPLQFAQRFEGIFMENIRALGLSAVDQYARASEHIPEIVNQVKTLARKGQAYLIKDDGYYFNLKTFPEYGRLSGRTMAMAEDGVSRIDDSPRKKNRGDFNLWKFSKPNEPFWDTDLGRGRPGWHIEDTAITEKYFGPRYDLHGAGQDLIFPHHEAEIAQMESISGLKPFVKHWLHVGFIIDKSGKMSKSKGNFLTLNDALKEYSAAAIRFYFASAHYRSPLEYDDKSLPQAYSAAARLEDFVRRLKDVAQTAAAFPLSDFTADFWKSLEDDFNTPKAWAVLFELVKEANKFIDSHSLSQNDAQKIIDFMGQVNDIFGILPTGETVPMEISALADRREKARAEKDFAAADKLREQIKTLGWDIDDTSTGSRINKL